MTQCPPLHPASAQDAAHREQLDAGAQSWEWCSAPASLAQWLFLECIIWTSFTVSVKLNRGSFLLVTSSGYIITLIWSYGQVKFTTALGQFPVGNFHLNCWKDCNEIDRDSWTYTVCHWTGVISSWSLQVPPSSTCLWQLCWLRHRLPELNIELFELGQFPLSHFWFHQGTWLWQSWQWHRQAEHNVGHGQTPVGHFTQLHDRDNADADRPWLTVEQGQLSLYWLYGKDIRLRGLRHWMWLIQTLKLVELSIPFSGGSFQLVVSSGYMTGILNWSKYSLSRFHTFPAPL